MSAVVETAPKILLTPREAAEALGISERKLWGLTVPRGPIPVVRIGKSVRYRPDALDHFASDQQQEAAPAMT